MIKIRDSDRRGGEKVRGRRREDREKKKRKGK